MDGWTLRNASCCRNCSWLGSPRTSLHVQHEQSYLHARWYQWWCWPADKTAMFLLTESLGITIKGEEPPCKTEARQSFDRSVRYIQNSQTIRELPRKGLNPGKGNWILMWHCLRDVIESCLHKALWRCSSRKWEVTSPCCDKRGLGDDQAKSGVWCLIIWRWLPVTEQLPTDWAISEPWPSSHLDKVQTSSNSLHGDIEKDYLQISLSEMDQDVMTFMWITGPPDAERTGSRIMRIRHVVFGMSSSPFLLVATMRTHLEKYKETQLHVVNTLKGSLYLDNLIASTSNVEEAYALTAGAKEILADVSINLCKWTTNSPELKTN